MKTAILNEEKEKIRSQIQRMKARIILKIEQGHYLGLDTKIRQIQKNYQLTQRI